jgi:PAS domain S-box-containing protein
MIRFDELAKAAAGYTRRLRQNFADSRLMRSIAGGRGDAFQRAYDELQAKVQELQGLNEGLRLDIAERKRTEENARLTEEGLRAVIDTIPALVVRRGADGKIEYVNQAWRTFTGLSRGETPETYEAAAMHPDDRLHVDPPWLSHFSKGELFETEYRLRRADGEYRWLSVRRMPQRDSNGKVIAWYGVGYDIEDRRRADTALLESKAFLAEAQKLSRTGSFGWNIASGELVWSEETFRIFGYAPNTNITFELVLDRVHPDDRVLVQRVIDRAATHKEPFDIELRLKMPDGSIKHLHVVASALVDESSHSKFAGAVMDITVRKKNEQALQLSEKRYHHLFQAMAVSLLELDYSLAGDTLRTLSRSGITDLGGYFRGDLHATRELLQKIRVVDVNDQAVDLFGRGSKEGLLDSVECYWPEESSGDFITAVMASFEGEKFSGETRLRRQDGSVFDAHFTMWYAFDDKARGLVGITDITARRQAFVALEKSEQRFRHLFHHTPVALWQLDGRPYAGIFQQLRADGVEDLGAYIDDHPDFLSNALDALVIQEANDHAIQLFGARDRKDLTDHPTHWMWRESIDTLRRSMESRWRGDESFQETTKLTTLDGRVIDVLYTVARPPMVENLPITLVSMIDITERVRAQEELRRMQADFAHAARVSMLGELTATIAHEINQPLAAIASTSQASLRWLAQPSPNIDKVRKLTSDVASDVERAAQIISRIRAMATGRVPEPVLLCPDDVIRDSLLFLRHEVASQGVAVSHFPAINQKVVLGDRTQLQQVIVNLAVNAVQAMAQAGSSKRSITFRTAWQNPTTLHCSVEDSGPGIAPRDLPRLFDSFFTTKDSGMGMGLRICRSVIEAHGGHIAADNESSQGGARFHFTLPATTTGAQAS